MQLGSVFLLVQIVAYQFLLTSSKITTQQTMAAMTEAEMMAALALVSDSNSDGNAGGGSMLSVLSCTRGPRFSGSKGIPWIDC